MKEKKLELMRDSNEDKIQGKLRPEKTNIIDICRIPNIYVQKNSEERLQDSCDVLSKMQNLMKRPKLNYN